MKLNANSCSKLSWFILFLFSNLICNAQPPDSSIAYYWKKGKVYQYTAHYFDNKGNLLSKGTVILRPTGEVWDADNKQTLADVEFEFQSEDSFNLAPFPTNGVFRPWIRKNQEGVMENNKRIWIHPFRNNQYQLTEIAPFPDVRLPVEKSKSWTSQLYIYEGFGSFEGDVESYYEIIGKEKRDYTFGELMCWKIEASGTHNKLGISFANFYFNEDVGFTEMNYLFFNKYRIIFKMEKFIP